MASAIRKIVGEAKVKPGKVKLDVPPLSENGNSVSLNVSVESPMTPTNYVKAIHVLTEKKSAALRRQRQNRAARRASGNLDPHAACRHARRGGPSPN